MWSKKVKDDQSLARRLQIDRAAVPGAVTPEAKLGDFPFIERGSPISSQMLQEIGDVWLPRFLRLEGDGLFNQYLASLTEDPKPTNERFGGYVDFFYFNLYEFLLGQPKLSADGKTYTHTTLTPAEAIDAFRQYLKDRIEINGPTGNSRFHEVAHDLLGCAFVTLIITWANHREWSILRSKNWSINMLLHLPKTVPCWMKCSAGLMICQYSARSDLGPHHGERWSCDTSSVHRRCADGHQKLFKVPAGASRTKDGRPNEEFFQTLRYFRTLQGDYPNKIKTIISRSYTRGADISEAEFEGSVYADLTRTTILGSFEVGTDGVTYRRVARGSTSATDVANFIDDLYVTATNDNYRAIRSAVRRDPAISQLLSLLRMKRASAWTPPPSWSAIMADIAFGIFQKDGSPSDVAFDDQGSCGSFEK